MLQFNCYQHILNNRVNFTSKVKQKPIVVYGDIFEKKSVDNLLDLVAVEDWDNKYNITHGYLTTAIGVATNPDVEIKAFDINNEKNLYQFVEQLTQIVEEAIRIKKQNPERPIFVNFSVSIGKAIEPRDFVDMMNGELSVLKSVYCDKFFLKCDDLEESYQKLIEPIIDFYKTVQKFLSLPDTKIYFSSGNNTEEINLLTLLNNDNLVSVRGTDSNSAILPFFSIDPFSKKADRAIFNIYKNDQGDRFIVVNDKKISLDYELFDRKNKPYTVYYYNTQDRISPQKEYLEYILGKELKGRPYEEVKDHLIPIKDIIEDNLIIPDGKYTRKQIRILFQFKEDFFKLNPIQKEYFEAKKDFYLPINIPTNVFIGGSSTDLERYYINYNKSLFIGVDDKGLTYWSPDGTKPRNDSIVVGFIGGTSFSTPISMMKEAASYSKDDSKISFTGTIKIMPPPKKLKFYA